MHAESGVQLRAGPAEPAKALGSPAQGGPRQGNQVVPVSPWRAKRGSAGTPGGGQEPGDPRGQPCVPRSGRVPPSWELPRWNLRARRGLLPTASPQQPQLLLFCRKKGNQGLFSPLGWMKSQGAAFSISVPFWSCFLLPSSQVCRGVGGGWGVGGCKHMLLCPAPSYWKGDACSWL